MTDNGKIWIEEGYHFFASQGPGEMRVERLAKTIGKNKSSFYHFFATIEILQEELLQYHLTQICAMANALEKAITLEDLTAILLDNKTHLLFNRQLRIHRQKPEFEHYLHKTNAVAGTAIMEVWKNMLELKNNSYLARLVLKLSVDNFFLQITEAQLDRDWLNTYFLQLREMVQAFKNKAPH
ncbi:TetR/AcrR family transcriptional regulator [Spongiimicrobium salis]|uniref:TetR/AcrR family transcriptional regulator n=1 Tax=Spongiimicrobium salis TaxID=1667022 RepID=UPI00374D346C